MADNPAFFTSLHFTNFKAFEHYSVSLKEMNILVGPNNCGKSTVISAFRILSEGLRRANARHPDLVPSPTGRSLGYPIFSEDVPVSLENVHTDYTDRSSKISFRLSNQNSLVLFFPVSGGCFLLTDAAGATPRTVSAFRRLFPVSVAAVPVLGPVEHNEPLVQERTVNRDQFTHRASRHFRSYWHYNPDGFRDFSEMLRSTWPGMDILPPERPDPFSGELVMFCKEGRIDRELYWAGFGFQVWCQMLTHISRSAGHTILAIDEPEIYLHPEIQRQLLSVLRSTGSDVLIATHSTEIMAEADPSEILLIDKARRSAQRLRDIAEVQAALDSVGSIQNITLTQLARSRKVVFVEADDDFGLLRRFADRLGLRELASGGELTAVESEGAASWEKIRDLSWGIERTLGSTLKIAAVFDRDYRSNEECAQVTQELSTRLEFCHIHQRKEIENYLLVPEAIARALARAVKERASRTGEDAPELVDVHQLLEQISEGHREDARSQFLAHRTKYLRHSGIDDADLARDTLAWFDSKWTELSSRLEIVPGKKVLQELRRRIQESYGVTLTDYRIVSAIRLDEIANDLVQLLERLDLFRAA